MDVINLQRNVSFLLSPANCSGQRAEMLFNPRASFELAVQLQSKSGAPLADVFSFLSGLYFRGKIAYARHFQPQPGTDTGIRIITAGRGLLPADIHVTLDDLCEFAGVSIDVGNPAYYEPLMRDARTLAEQLSPEGKVILLGSIATDKYTKALLEVFGDRVLFPKLFVGRGDMSRGGLMLRCVDAGEELEYESVLGAIRHGKRPAKLTPRHSPAG